MKKEGKNIEEMFQKTFDGYEANVDPSVWSNVSNSINGGLASSSVASSVALKIVAGIFAVSSIVTATYYLTKDKKISGDIISEEIVVDKIEQDNQIATIEEKVFSQNKDISEEESRTEVYNVENEEVDLKVDSQENAETEDAKSEVAGDESTGNEDDINVIEESISSPTTEIRNDQNPEQSNKNINKEDIKDFEVEILTTTTEGYAPLEVEFNIDGDVVSAVWDFNDGTTSNQKTAYHTFDQPGEYVVTLNVLDKNNRDKKVAKTIIVKSNFPSNIEPIQNVITPNGDNQNDVFKIKGENIQKLEVFIMDVNGSVINSITSIDAQWDGRNQMGEIVAPGTYVVSGMAVGIDGETHTIKSFITVLK